MNDINLEEAAFIDVRTPEEFTEDHLSGALNIPLEEIFHMVEDFDEMKKPIVLYCRSGARSQQAVEFLKDQGVEEVYNGGGLDNLKKILK